MKMKKISLFMIFGLSIVVIMIVMFVKNRKKVFYNPLNIRFSNDDLRMIANNLLWAMNRLGTKENVLFSSLEGLNGDELRQVYNFFGRRTYDTYKRAVLIGEKIDLFQWFIRELTKKELMLMRQIWEKSKLPFPEN